MSKARKTIELSTLVDIANSMLAKSWDEMTESRTGISVLLERVLMDSNAYAGFGYLQIETDTKTGEVISLGDETRRKYYQPRT
jgi:hypothetical protein